MDISELSFLAAISRDNLQREKEGRFTLYSSLIRVGICTTFASLAVFLIVLIVVAPSLITVPLGETGTVLFGLLSSAISYKIYRAIKVSNSTVLAAGRGVATPDRLWKKSTKTTSRRVVSSLIFLVTAPIAPYVGLKFLDFVSMSTASYREGFLSDLSWGAELIVVLSVIAFNAGLLTIALGCLLLFWSLTTPFRSAVMRSYRYLRLQLIRAIYRGVERVSGVSQYSDPEKICDACFSASFRLQSNDDGLTEYELVCARCMRRFATLQDYQEPSRGAEAVEAVNSEDGRVAIQD